LPQIAKHLHQPEMFNGKTVLNILSWLNLNQSSCPRGKWVGSRVPSHWRQGGLGTEPPALDDFWDLLPK